MNVSLPRLLVIELTVIASGVIIYFAGNLIGKFEEVALVLAFATLLTYALLPAVNFLDRFRRVPRGLGVLVVYLLMFALIAGAIALISVPLGRQVEQLAREYPRYSDEFRGSVMPHLQSELDKRNIHVDLAGQVRDYSDNLKDAAGDITTKSGHIVAKFFGTVSALFFILLVSVYFLLSGDKFAASMIGLFPRRRQRLVKKLARDYDRIIGSFVRGNLVVGFIVFVVVTLFSLIVGLPYSVLTGLVAGLTSLIPVIGAFLGVFLPVLIAAFVHPVLIPVLLVFFFVLNELVHKVLYPKIVGDALELHPVVVLIGVLLGVKLAGVAGALLATPLIALAKVTIIALRNSAGYGRV